MDGLTTYNLFYTYTVFFLFLPHLPGEMMKNLTHIFHFGVGEKPPTGANHTGTHECGGLDLSHGGVSSVSPAKIRSGGIET